MDYAFVMSVLGVGTGWGGGRRWQAFDLYLVTTHVLHTPVFCHPDTATDPVR